jgi:hypothetical protein
MRRFGSQFGRHVDVGLSRLQPGLCVCGRFQNDIMFDVTLPAWTLPDLFPSLCQTYHSFGIRLSQYLLISQTLHDLSGPGNRSNARGGELERDRRRLSQSPLDVTRDSLLRVSGLLSFSDSWNRTPNFVVRDTKLSRRRDKPENRHVQSEPASP